ncbi:U6 small nuclear RNA (adenine-(43)-N(6))-methyltransferase [Nomia melanderi]|uniref:U6 small nuclear RNA (adenine-(43)-N(6))-methyltransferase n=1 Tax=Nomia melanderi TaxID=2448451 RepID=UPI0013044C3C|nr:U6 small nuclear RNA (adenine-(43)-N(6))-methyltransferase [Nomia melanderi]XP_031844275.1 U6 small nuclear RNA (adenine-(43)-N(6))-methyltransferase [Nomia melanderi]XP_031844276.1 U6 small nuclear RNA (adenine-(43)-N(6))-methyltransferase [Nomia melanderi]
MSLRKFMHPRNPYKKIPDFKHLALSYPSFCNIANIDLTGKVKIDFKNGESLRVLTEVLLKHDFNLEVKIPPNKLVPTLPLRLNYVLWIEDLIKHSSFCEMKETIGIDIGTGAVCIYPLLFAKMYGNRMIGTEVDETSIQTAIQQVENNNLQHLIKVLKVDGQTTFKDIVKEGETYHFTMCNPPFFETERSERIIKCLPPRNAPTGNKAELTIQGGERAFVTQMIDESSEMKDKIKIYTTMFGRRSNLLFLLKLLKRRKIENTTWTEFCQGHTKRWGLAWTFLPKDVIDLTTASVIRKSGDYIAKLLKEKRPTEIQFPMQDKFSSFDNLINFLEESMEELHIHVKELNLPIDDFNGWSCQLVAENDSWSHARRKRRLAQRQMNQCEDHNINSNADCSEKNTVEELNQGDAKIASDQIHDQNCSHTTDPFLVCNFFVELVEHEEDSERDSIRISMIFEKGSGGRNALETFKQYLINKLDVRDHFQKQHIALQRKKRKRLKKNESVTCDNDMNQSGSSHEQNVESC